MAGRTINQYMWGFQDVFRMSVEHEANRVLNRIGLRVKPEIYLVGFLVPGGDRHPICIEPETGPFAPLDLIDVPRRTEEIFGEDPEREIIYSDRRIREQRQLALRDRARARAVKEALETRRVAGGLTFYVGRSVKVEQHDVYTIIGLPKGALSSLPRLQTQVKDRIPVVGSLVDGVVQEILRLGARALFGPNPGAELNVLDAEDSEIARAAANRLVTSAVVLSGELMGGDLYNALNEISTLRYEQRVGIGSVVLARAHHPAVEEVITLRSDVKLSEHRAVRKLLEVSDRRPLSLLTNGRVVYGLGSLGSEYKATEESAFELLVVGQGTWELRHADGALVRVQFGSPQIPRPRLDPERFEDTVDRVFANSPNRRHERLWALTEAAAQAEHGTMLVVSEAAGQEAERLQAQALPIEPVVLSADMIARLTGIDGAVLLSPDGTCHAMGVILDGAASGAGDRSRGARFNSAVRYLQSAADPSMIILVSEDGMIDLLPDLKLRVTRGEVDAALEAVRLTAEAEEFDFERFFNAFEQLEALKFYLSAEQCAEANAFRDQIEHRRWQENHIRIKHTPLRPDPAMNDSYFLDE